MFFFHGPPAAGKLTVAREFSRLTGIPVFHNHLVVDLLTPVFPFGSESFVELREQMWLTVFLAAARERRPLVFTFAPERTVRPDFVSRVVETVESVGSQVHFVKLTCPSEELERRIEAPTRRAFGKLASVSQFRALERAGAFEFPPLPDSALSIDTSRYAPEVAARLIALHFSIPIVAEP